MKIIDTNGTELTEHTFEDWQKEFERKHPILNKIDHLFKDKSIAGYRASHTLTHPWIFIEEGWRQICWAWQRVFRGWDDRVIWAIDFHLATVIPQWLKRLKEINHGIPMIFFTKDDLENLEGISDEASVIAGKKFNDVLESIISGFESYIKMDNIINPREAEYKLEEENFNSGFELFKKYFSTLAD